MNGISLEFMVEGEIMMDGINLECIYEGNVRFYESRVL